MKKAWILGIVLTTIGLGACQESLLSPASVGALSDAAKAFTASKEQLKQASLQSVAQMDQKAQQAPPSSPYAQRLARLSREFSAVDGTPLNFKVYLNPELNAFATPDGSIRVFSGLMDLLQDDDELMAVIGHEIGHIHHQHSLEQYKKAYLASAGRKSITALAGDNVLGALAASQYGAIAEQYLNAQFSQRDELESDQFGLALLRQQGRDPNAAVRVHQKFLQRMGNGGGFMSSHPSSQARIDALNAAISASR